MATISQSGLFPPQVDNFLPAYNVRNVVGENGGITVYYNISQYNDIDDINSVHLSFVRQTNYHIITQVTPYPLGIVGYNKESIIKTTSEDPIEYQGDGWYKTFVDRSDVFNFNDAGKKGELAYNTYYKFQVRLSKDTIPANKMTGSAFSAYLNDEANLPLFSEWSQVCLLRFIAPRQTLFRINEKQWVWLSAIEDTASFTGDQKVESNFLEISGRWEPATQDHSRWNDHCIPESDMQYYTAAILDGWAYDQEYMSSYQVSVYNGNTLIHQSPEITPEYKNEFKYSIPCLFENGTYDIKILFKSANLYEEEKIFTVQTEYDTTSWVDPRNFVTETTGVDTAVGKVSICLECNVGSAYLPKKIIIRRADHTTDFKVWETMYLIENPTNAAFPLTYDDYTIESGTLYKYEIVAPRIINNKYVNFSIIEGPALSIFDHAFLTGEHTQLPVKFNPNISSYKHTVSDNIINTIGSQFPYITRNGDMNYRTFSLSGTVAYEMDIRHEFATQDDLYNGYTDVFGSYFVNHYMDTSNDRLTQRKFRELVMAFLYDDKPKLFRSTPEGNILVRITDVSLTPNQTLGRMIYDFSCTATEIGEATIENCKLYDIQNFGIA